MLISMVAFIALPCRIGINARERCVSTCTSREMFEFSITSRLFDARDCQQILIRTNTRGHARERTLRSPDNNRQQSCAPEQKSRHLRARARARAFRKSSRIARGQIVRLIFVWEGLLARVTERVEREFPIGGSDRRGVGALNAKPVALRRSVTAAALHRSNAAPLISATPRFGNLRRAAPRDSNHSRPVRQGESFERCPIFRLAIHAMDVSVH